MAQDRWDNGGHRDRHQLSWRETQAVQRNKEELKEKPSSADLPPGLDRFLFLKHQGGHILSGQRIPHCFCPPCGPALCLIHLVDFDKARCGIGHLHDGARFTNLPVQQKPHGDSSERLKIK